MQNLALVFFASLALQAQTPPTQPAPAVVPSLSNPESNLPTQKIGPDDLLSVAVADCPELTRNFRVAADGTLALPLLNARINVAGKIPSEIEMQIAEALVKDQILVRPVVSVSVAEYRSVPVSVLGAVRRPITFQAVGEVTLLDALTKAEGLTPEAGPEILVSRHHSQDGAPAQQGTSGLVQRIPVKGLLDEADPSLNIRLYGGEEIRVPQAGRVYVIGNVKKSGAFPIQDSGDTTVLKVLALSEGLLPYSTTDAYIYRREAGKAGRDEIPIQLSQIMNRKAPDVPLKADDILYIPDNKHRRMTMTALERIAGFGTATASGLLIFH
ncbi:MAG: polysaccharide biosynthesis/export family protein [Bryobacteraceae bacterium]